VLIRDGRIVAVGTSVSIPSGATRIDAAGKMDHAGLIDATGQLRPGGDQRGAGTREASVRVTPSRPPSMWWRESTRASTLIPVTRIEGITPPSPFRPAIS